MEKDVDALLPVDEEDVPTIIKDECAAVKPIIQDFVECYAANKDKPVNEWLGKKLQESLPEKSSEEIQEMTEEIITTIQLDENNKASLSEAVANGRSKESWFASETQKVTSAMSAQQTSNYLVKLDAAVVDANKALYRTITTKAGAVNWNPRLDGLIAEQYHVQTFNLNAAASDSQYRARGLEPNGKGYAKNSVDIVVADGNGKIAQRYQSKYCKDANATARAFEHGDYRGQQKLVPDGQQADIQKKSTNVLKAPDGTTSNPLSKSSAEQLRDEAQSGQWNEFDWNKYKTKDLALGIGKRAGHAALQGAAIGVGFDIAQKLWNGEEIEGEEVVKTAIVSGADFGLKASIGGALKVGVEKEIITVIPKGTPAGTIANIAFVAIEDVKVIYEMVTGELTFMEGIEKIEQTTVATAAGLATMVEGATIGAAAGMIFGPVGIAVGEFVGGAVAYMAGSKIGETIVKGAQVMCKGAFEVIKTIGNGIKNVASAVVGAVENVFCGIASFLGF